MSYSKTWIGSAAALVMASTFAIGAQAADPTRFVSLSGTDNPTCDRAHPCRHVQHAVNAASPGDTIRIDTGTYVEQVTIAKSLTIHGTGRDSTTIKAPDVKALNAHGRTFVVDISGPATARLLGLAVSGPGSPGGGNNCAANPLSLDKGVDVHLGATLDLFGAAVRDIFDIPASGCQRGDAISVGSACFTCAPEVGHAHITDVIVSVYQKNGVAVRGAGSTLRLTGSSVENKPSAIIASNGVEVLAGAAGEVRQNRVSGNQCNLAVICGPDPLTNTEASGILIFGATPATTVAQNLVFANDMGVYTDDGITIRENSISNNRAVGLFVDNDATGGHFEGNVTNRDGRYGIAIGPPLPTPNPGGNFFANNTAFDNTTFDLYQAPGNGPNFNRDNRCGTALPSRRYWACTAGDRDQDDGVGGRGRDERGEQRRSSRAAPRDL